MLESIKAFFASPFSSRPAPKRRTIDVDIEEEEPTIPGFNDHASKRRRQREEDRAASVGGVPDM